MPEFDKEAGLMMAARDAEIANARMDTHEAVCTERHKNLLQSINDIKAMILSQGIDYQNRLNALSAESHSRFNTISNRMWVALTSVLGASILALVAVVYHLMTEGGHHL